MGWSLLLFVALASAPQGAASATRAEALTRRAIIEYNGGEFDQALVDAEKAYALQPAPVLLYDLGQINRALHHWEEAAFSYRAYLREVPDAKNRPTVEAFIRDVEAKQRGQLDRTAPEPPVPLPPQTPAVATPPVPAEPPPAQPPKSRSHHIAVLDVQAQGNIPPGVAQGVTSVVVHDVRERAAGATVVGADEIRAMVGLERQKQLLGCTEMSCLAEIGGALGADRLVLGSLSRFGETYVVDLKLVEARTAKVLAEGSTRVQQEDGLPDAVGKSLDGLFPKAADRSARPELTQGTETAPRSHALAWTLFGASAVAVGFAVYGTVRVANVEGEIGQLDTTASAYESNLGNALTGRANAQNWQWAAIGLGAVAIAATVTGVLTW